MTPALSRLPWDLRPPSSAGDRSYEARSFSVFLPGEPMFLRLSGSGKRYHVQLGNQCRDASPTPSKRASPIRWTPKIPVDVPTGLSRAEVEAWVQRCFPGSTLVPNGPGRKKKRHSAPLLLSGDGHSGDGLAAPDMVEVKISPSDPARSAAPRR